MENRPTPHPITPRPRLTDAEFEAVKALHAAVRGALRSATHAAFSATGFADPKSDRHAASTQHAVDVAGQNHRIALLAWAFVRGLPYRRVEPHRHLQVTWIGDDAQVIVHGEEIDTRGVTFYEHNRPAGLGLHAFLRRFIPDLTEARVRAWLDEPHRASASHLSALVQRAADRVAAEVLAEQVAQNRENAQLAPGPVVLTA